jgi:hypothetical protein
MRTYCGQPFQGRENLACLFVLGDHVKHTLSKTGKKDEQKEFIQKHISLGKAITSRWMIPKNY